MNGSRQSRRCDDSAIAAETFVYNTKMNSDQIMFGKQGLGFSVDSPVVAARAIVAITAAAGCS